MNQAPGRVSAKNKKRRSPVSLPGAAKEERSN